LPPSADAATMAKWITENPTSFHGLTRYAKLLLAQQQWETAKEPLNKLVELYPDYAGADNAHQMLAVVSRKLGDTAGERAALNTVGRLDADAIDVFLRLLEIGEAEEDWKATIDSAQRLLAVNPLLAAPHRYLAKAAEQTGETALAIDGLRALAEMEPFDPAEVHYRLAKLLYEQQALPEARLEVLKSLEEAPRYRKAHGLLLVILDDIGLAKKRGQIP
jgi:tetratricopeptide (TPR) repeat protein